MKRLWTTIFLAWEEAIIGVIETEILSRNDLVYVGSL